MPWQGDGDAQAGGGGKKPASGRGSTVEKGQMYEEKACKYLASHGYRIIRRNFRYGKVGEIDIIAYDENVLVFVEVKYRENNQYGRPEDSIDYRKQSQLKRVAKMYYYVNAIQDQACRFDVVAFEIVDGREQLRHHKEAFY